MDLTVPYTFYPLALPHWIACTLFALAMLCGGAGLLGTMGFLAATILASMVRGAFVESWPFADGPNTASITTRQVLEGAPVLLVTHDADDGCWQFLCGTTNDSDDARVVGLGQMYRRDVTLGELADLPEGWRAFRSAAGLPWQRSPHLGALE